MKLPLADILPGGDFNRQLRFLFLPHWCSWEFSLPLPLSHFWDQPFTSILSNLRDERGITDPGCGHPSHLGGGRRGAHHHPHRNQHARRWGSPRAKMRKRLGEGEPNSRLGHPNSLSQAQSIHSNRRRRGTIYHLQTLDMGQLRTRIQRPDPWRPQLHPRNPTVPRTHSEN